MKQKIIVLEVERDKEWLNKWNQTLLPMILLKKYKSEIIMIKKDFIPRHYNWNKILNKQFSKILVWRLKYKFCRKKKKRKIN